MAGDCAPHTLNDLDESMTLTSKGRCPACDQPVWTVADCRCGHSESVHDLNPKNERTKCLTAVGPKGERCGCSRFVEVPDA